MGNFIFEVIDRETGERFWFDLSWGNKWWVGTGWLCVLPWGQQERYSGGINGSDNRMTIDQDHVKVTQMTFGEPTLENTCPRTW